MSFPESVCFFFLSRVTPVSKQKGKKGKRILFLWFRHLSGRRNQLAQLLNFSR